jgi:hypothetical protein
MFLSAWTVQRCSIAPGHSSLVAFQIAGAVGDDQRRRPHPAGLHVTAELQPAVVAPAAAELQPEQDLLALQRDAPRHQHTLDPARHLGAA